MKTDFVIEDYILIAVDPLSRFAIRFACLNNAIQKTIGIHKAEGALGMVFSEFVVGAILLGSRADDQESCIYKLKLSQCALSFNCEVSPLGFFRAALFPDEKQNEFCLPLSGTMEVNRLKKDKSLYQSLSEINKDGINATLKDYLELSLQRAAFMAVHAENTSFTQNFGLWVEKLPDTPETEWAVFSRRFSQPDFFKNSFAESSDPDRIMGKLFPEGFRVLAVTKPRFECSCNKERIITALSSLPEKDLVEVFMEGSGISINCEYCHKDWLIEDADIKSLIKTSSALH